MSLSPLHALGLVNLLPAGVRLPEVSVSADFAGMLSDALERLVPGSDAPKRQPDAQRPHAVPQSIDVEGMRQRTQVFLKAFHAQVSALLRADGLELGSGVSLGLDDAGRLRVANDHPQSQAIEQALGRHPELVAMFQAIAANTQTLGEFATPPDAVLIDVRPEGAVFVPAVSFTAAAHPA